MIKVDSEVTNLRQSSRFTAWLFRRIVEYIEDILENEKEVKHTKIQKHIEQVLDDEEILNKFTKLYPAIDSHFLDIPLPVLV
jgi:nucleosome binding factor SPN SPT16 subunit|tara:strand:- start:123 stop:368 length:246 start_codon:yes stop_codon:yes gene_type:complete